MSARRSRAFSAQSSSSPRRARPSSPPKRGPISRATPAPPQNPTPPPRPRGSGTAPATIARGGFTTLRLAALALLRARDEMTDEDMMAFMRACMLDAREPAPSVETPLHALLPHRFIVHTHDFATQALTDTSRPEENVRAAFGDEVDYVDYVRPGFPLARALAPALARYADEPRAAFARPRPAADMLPPVPRVALLPGLGVVACLKDKGNAALGALCYRHGARVIAAAEALGGFAFLDEA